METLLMEIIIRELSDGGHLTEELWHLQLVSKRVRSLYRDCVTYKDFTMNTIWRNREDGIGLIRDHAHNMKYILSVIPADAFTTRQSIETAMFTGIFQYASLKKLRLFLDYRNIRDDADLICTHMIHQSQYIRMLEVRKMNKDISLVTAVREANKYFYIIRNINKYLHHLTSIICNPMISFAKDPKKAITNVLALSAFSPKKRKRAYIRLRTLVTIYKNNPRYTCRRGIVYAQYHHILTNPLWGI